MNGKVGNHCNVSNRGEGVYILLLNRVYTFNEKYVSVFDKGPIQLPEAPL